MEAQPPIRASEPYDLYPGVSTSLERQVQSLGATPDKYVMEYRMLPMRDGVRLETTVIRPRAPGRVPVVMERTPYTFHLGHEVFRRVFEAGWAVVIQTERGSGWSEGEFGFLNRVAADCADTLTWIEGQEWSNGHVGLIGCSSPAENQLRIAAQGHPVLKACVPMSAGAGVGNVPGNEGSNGMFYKGGIPIISTWTDWYYPHAIVRRPRLPETDDADDLTRAIRHFQLSASDTASTEYQTALRRQMPVPPSRDILHRLGVPRNDYARYMGATPSDPVWDDVDFIHVEHSGSTPQININGWLDIGAYETVKLFEFQQHHPDQYLVVAASSHCAMIRAAVPNAFLGDRFMGNTVFPYDDIIMAWFRRFLADEPDAWKGMPKVQVFLMGANQWLKGERWPLAETAPGTLYLRSDGHAQTLWGDGELQEEHSDAARSADDLMSDPEKPVQTVGIAYKYEPIVADQSVVEARSDVLVYSTPPVDDGVAMVGDVDAVLFVSSDVPDADIFIKLVDVYPDGIAYNVGWSALRLRFRDGYDHPTPLTPHQIYEVKIRGLTTANYFGPGHRVRVELAGSNFPLADRNWHTGGQNEAEVKGTVAHLTVYHDREHPSRIEFRKYMGTLHAQPANP